MGLGFRPDLAGPSNYPVEVRRDSTWAVLAGMLSGLVRRVKKVLRFACCVARGGCGDRDRGGVLRG